MNTHTATHAPAHTRKTQAHPHAGINTPFFEVGSEIGGIGNFFAHECLHRDKRSTWIHDEDPEPATCAHDFECQASRPHELCYTRTQPLMFVHARQFSTHTAVSHMILFMKVSRVFSKRNPQLMLRSSPSCAAEVLSMSTGWVCCCNLLFFSSCRAKYQAIGTGTVNKMEITSGVAIDT